MTKQIKNPRSAKHSTAAKTNSARDAQTTFRANSRPNAPLLTITGAVSNPFLYSLRKAFREYIVDESKGYLNSIATLDKKLAAAGLLFPQERGRLYQLLTDKTPQP